MDEPDEFFAYDSIPSEPDRSDWPDNRLGIDKDDCADRYEWYKKMAAICEQYAESMNTAAQRYQETDAEAAGTIRAK